LGWKVPGAGWVGTTGTPVKGTHLTGATPCGELLKENKGSALRKFTSAPWTKSRGGHFIKKAPTGGDPGGGGSLRKGYGRAQNQERSVRRTGKTWGGAPRKTVPPARTGNYRQKRKKSTRTGAKPKPGKPDSFAKKQGGYQRWGGLTPPSARRCWKNGPSKKKGATRFRKKDGRGGGLHAPWEA